MAIDRVATRVVQGGHNVPEDVIKRRFLAGLNNFHTVYKPLVNALILGRLPWSDPISMGVCQE